MVQSLFLTDYFDMNLEFILQIIITIVFVNFSLYHSAFLYCLWERFCESNFINLFHVHLILFICFFPFVFVMSTFSYYRCVNCVITAPMRLLMIHAVYFCDHNSVVNCGIIVNFLCVFFLVPNFTFFFRLWLFEK